MSKFLNGTRYPMWLLTLMLAVFAAGCGQDGGKGGKGGTGGTGGDGADTGGDVSDTSRPSVTLTAPADTASNVPTNMQVVVTFSEDMQPATVSSTTFALTCATCTEMNPVGNVSYAVDTRTATLSVPAGLEASQTYTATVTTGATDLAGNALAGDPALLPDASDYLWTFTTNATAADTTAPAVTLTTPADGATDVAVNKQVVATFSEDMDPATISATTFALTCAACVDTNPVGSVSYAVGARTATLSIAAGLEANQTYTATVTTGATDLASNALAGNQAPPPTASDFLWTFTTGATADTTPPTVSSVTPASLATGQCLQQSVNASFSEDMDPATLTTATFTLQETGPPLGTVLVGSVVYDVESRTATFTANSDLVENTDYTATLTTSVEDLAGNALASNEVWTFTTGSQDCLAPIDLGTAAPLGTMGGGSGMTNQGTLTVINGDIASAASATTSVTGFHDTAGDIYTETGANQGTVNGTIYTCTTSTTGPTSAAVNPSACSIAQDAASDAVTAYNYLASLPAGSDPGAGSLGNLVLAPGVYTSAAGSFLIQGNDLTLDAQGDANAQWIFQMATTLTVGGPGAALPQSVVLINGAQAKNVFWQVGSAATINAGGGGTMVGTIISSAGTSFSTAGNVDIVTLNGRALSLNASVTLVNTVINVPAP